jgi:hypothetical protein
MDHHVARSIAVETLARMFTSQKISLADTFPSIWKHWLAKCHDKSPDIRILWLKNVSKVLEKHSHMSELLGIFFKLILYRNDCFKVTRPR